MEEEEEARVGGDALAVRVVAVATDADEAVDCGRGGAAILGFISRGRQRPKATGMLGAFVSPAFCCASSKSRGVSTEK